MNNLSQYILEKLHLNKETKVKDPEQFTTKFKLHENKLVDLMLYILDFKDNYDIADVLETWIKTFKIKKDIMTFCAEHANLPDGVSLSVIEDEDAIRLYKQDKKRFKELYNKNGIEIYSDESSLGQKYPSNNLLVKKPGKLNIYYFKGVY